MFVLSASDNEKFETWVKDHTASRDVLGTQYTFSFTPTGLGLITTVTNLVTNAILDLTEYDNW
jgi:hypothetical protein